MVLIHRGTLMQTAALFSRTAAQIRLCCVWIARQRIEKLLSFLIVFTHHLQTWDKCCALWDFSYLCVCVCVCGCMRVCPGKPYVMVTNCPHKDGIFRKSLTLLLGTFLVLVWKI